MRDAIVAKALMTMNNTHMHTLTLRSVPLLYLTSDRWGGQSAISTGAPLQLAAVTLKFLYGAFPSGRDIARIVVYFFPNAIHLIFRGLGASAFMCGNWCRWATTEDVYSRKPQTQGQKKEEDAPFWVAPLFIITVFLEILSTNQLNNKMYCNIGINYIILLHKQLVINGNLFTSYQKTRVSKPGYCCYRKELLAAES